MSGTHDINSPSSLFRRELCPGSGRMEEQVGEGETSPAAAEGIRKHEVMAECAHQRSRDPITEFDTDSPEDREGLEYCWAEMEKLLDQAKKENALVLVEHHLDLEEVGISKGGTLDFAIVKPGEWFTLVDWKFGTGWVAAPFYNRQMHAYACGLKQEFGCQYGTAMIVQPHAIGEKTKSASFEDYEIEQLYARLKEIVRRAKDPNARLIPGSHCQYCKALSSCPARRALAESATAQAPISVVSTLKSLPPESRHEYFERMRLALAWLGAAVKDVEQSILTGDLTINGFKVGEGRSSRVWADISKAEQLLVQELGQAAYERKLLSPAQAEKRLAEVGGGKRRVTTLLQDLVAQKPGHPRVVRDGSSGMIDEGGQ